MGGLGAFDLNTDTIAYGIDTALKACGDRENLALLSGHVQKRFRLAVAYLTHRPERSVQLVRHRGHDSGRLFPDAVYRPSAWQRRLWRLGSRGLLYQLSEPARSGHGQLRGPLRLQRSRHQGP